MKNSTNIVLMLFSCGIVLTLTALSSAAREYDENAAREARSVLLAPQDAPPVPQDSPSDLSQAPAVVTKIEPQAVAPCASCSAPAPVACNSCCCQPCCCPPPPVHTVLCLQDPCGCCTYEAKVCIPACCVNVQPVVQWRNGIFGRKIATVCWTCCDHEVRVVVTKHGKVRVRG